MVFQTQLNSDTWKVTVLEFIAAEEQLKYTPVIEKTNVELILLTLGPWYEYVNQWLAVLMPYFVYKRLHVSHWKC